MAVITSSIGTTGRDYSTLQAWEDALPADVVASGNSYVGECYNDSQFTAGIDFSAHTTGASNTITLTAATGQSFIDHASVRTNALVYDQSKGVGISVTSSYSYGLQFSATHNYFTLSRLQIKTTHAKTRVTLDLGGGGANTTFRDCIFDGNSEDAQVYEHYGNLINCVVIDRHATGHGVYQRGLDTHLVHGCTIVRLTDNSTSGDGVVARNYATVTLVSCAIFGFTNPATTAGSGSYTGSKNNATQAASGLPGLT
jgi:hypothetical protein